MYIDIQVVSIMYHTLNMEQSEQFQKQVYYVPPEILVKSASSRMLGTHGHNWMNKKKKKPHAIGTLVNHEEYMGYLDKDKLLTHRFCNILDQMLRWAAASSMFKKGTHSLLPRYINISEQLNEYDCAVYVMKWMEFIDPTVLIDCSKGNKAYNIETWTEPKLEKFRKSIVAKIMLSESNAWKMDTIRKTNGMRNTRPAPILRSPYIQVSSADLPNK
ncbi:hypothetical protein PIB30_079031 [Stylosanthes scabra]|uniref:Ubiquitin-like protease family profile domain-containing protein n=1 Tax=Stylosanthes scabra TaxID=79078 RepID=A0ABU6VS27_9FABA|nr:hypothetical protein [Stylosanthes scabra]